MNDEETNLEEELQEPEVPQQSTNLAFNVGSEDLGEVTGGGTYAPPFKSKIGNSTIDLSDKAAQDKMLEEYDTWWKHGLNYGVVAGDKKDERNRLRNEWYKKYHGMEYEQYAAEKDKEPKTTMYGFTLDTKGINEYTKTMKERLSAPGKGLVDFFFDAVGTLGGETGDKIDDRWDMATKFDDPMAQQIAEVSSVVLPSIMTGNATTGMLNSTALKNMPFLAKLITNSGAWYLESQIIAGLSDTSEQHNLAGSLVKLWPNTYGVGGRFPLPESFVTYDEDSPSVRKEKNKKEAGALSLISTIAGGAIRFMRAKELGQAAPKKMEWYIPKDETAVKYKQQALFKGAEEDILIKIQEIEETLSTKKLSKQNENVLINELMALEDEISRLNTVDDVARQADTSIIEETQAAKNRKVENPDQLELDFGIDPDFDDLDLLDPASKARQIVPDGNVARNMADTTAIKLGDAVGDPAPIITEAMREKGMMIGDKSRDVVMGIAESARMSGNFDAIVDGFRYSTEQMNGAAWAIFRDIISADNLTDVKSLFVSDRDVRNMLFGRFKVETVNEEQARGIAWAIKYLTDRFLGYDIATSTARVMDTLGREISTMAEAVQDFAPDWIDDDRVTGLILDKLNYLMNEYSLNKYVAGWALRNKNWFNTIPPGEMEEIIDRITREFTSAQNSIHAKNKKFTATLKSLKKTMPEAIKPLIDVFRATDGDVVDLAQLYKWTEQQITPWGAIKSPNPKEMNFFAKGLWSNHMNFTLSGKAPLNAAIGNIYQIMVKPITSILGSMPYAIAARDADPIRRTIYFHGAVFETNRRALKHAFRIMKQAHKDPDNLLKAYRKDFRIKEDNVKDVLVNMRKVYEKDNNFGALWQIDTAINIHEIGRIPAARYGLTGLMFPDAYASDMIGTYAARMKAYDEVLYEFGAIPDKGGMDLVRTAEARLAADKFDSNGLLKDDVAKAIAGEVQLNIDDGMSRWINQAITAYPAMRYLLMFPRTQNNWIKNAASWTPITLIPGVSRYNKTIFARTDEEVASALLEHGIDMTNTPNARVVFEQLRADYTGRLMFSSMLASSLFAYAMTGNIVGNGHYKDDIRRKQRDQFGRVPGTVKIGDTWVKYDHLPGSEVLKIMADLAMYLRDLDGPIVEDIMSKVIWTLTASFNNNTPMASIEPLIAIINGDLSGFNRLAAQITRSFIPFSSALGVLSQAIDGAQKDIQGEYLEYLANRIPGARNQLADYINPLGGANNGRVGPNWNNPWDVIVSAVNPFHVTQQPGGDSMTYKTKTGKVVSFNDVMYWLSTSNYRGLSRLNMDSTGSYKYSAKQREQIMSHMAEMQLWRDIAEIMVKPETQRQLDEAKEYVNKNRIDKNEQIELNFQLLPYIREIDTVLKNGQIVAENRYNIGMDTIIDQQFVDRDIKQGNIKKASEREKKNLETQKLLEYNNN